VSPTTSVLPEKFTSTPKPGHKGHKGGKLPFTGAPLAFGAALAAALLAGGVLLVTASKRRRAGSHR
jgi:hypothetical protein